MNPSSAAVWLAFSVLSAATLSAQATRRWDIPASARTLVGITLNRDSAGSVHRTFGAATSWDTGDDHDELRNWCYAVGNGASGVTVRFASDVSELGGTGLPINLVVLERGAREQLNGHTCAPSALPADAPAGLRLGMTADDVKAILGAAHRRTTDSLVYEVSDREPMDPHGPSFAAWNTPERRRDCFDGGTPFSWVAGKVVLLLRNGVVDSIWLERYNNATC